MGQMFGKQADMCQTATAATVLSSSLLPLQLLQWMTKCRVQVWLSQDVGNHEEFTSHFVQLIMRSALNHLMFSVCPRLFDCVQALATRRRSERGQVSSCFFFCGNCICMKGRSCLPVQPWRRMETDGTQKVWLRGAHPPQFWLLRRPTAGCKME